MMMPLVVEPRNRPRVPDIIIVDDSDDEIKEQKAPEQHPEVQVIDKKAVQPEVKPTPPPQPDSLAKKTRQAKEKALQKKNSAPAKVVQTITPPSKKATRALVTKPPIVD